LDSLRSCLSKLGGFGEKKQFWAAFACCSTKRLVNSSVHQCDAKWVWTWCAHDLYKRECDHNLHVMQFGAGLWEMQTTRIQSPLCLLKPQCGAWTCCRKTKQSSLHQTACGMLSGTKMLSQWSTSSSRCAAFNGCHANIINGCRAALAVGLLISRCKTDLLVLASMSVRDAHLFSVSIPGGARGTGQVQACSTRCPEPCAGCLAERHC